MMTQTLMIFVVAVLGYLNSYLASAMICRPMVMGTLVGLVLGDLQTGVMVGATLELVWLGAMAIGASNPPDMISGSIIGTAYVIVTGSDVAASVALAVPVSMLMQSLWNLMMMIIVPMLAAKADKYALACDNKGIDRMHYIAIIIQVGILSVLTAIGFYVGSSVMENLVNSIPVFITNGLNYAMGIIPAIGFAMLARMIVNKKLACFLFFAFLLVAYFNLSIVGVTAIACVVAAILIFNTNGMENREVAVDDNEF